MSAKSERQMREDRALRDAALALVKADISHLKNDVSAKGVGARLATRMSDGATDVFEEAVEVADSNRGILTALLAAVVLWFARNPIMELFRDDEHNSDDQETFSEDALSDD